MTHEVDRAEHRWGFADGQQVDIYPLDGLRGLLRSMPLTSLTAKLEVRARRFSLPLIEP